MPPLPPKVPPTKRVQRFFKRQYRRFCHRVVNVCNYVERSVSKLPFVNKNNSTPAECTRCLKGQVIGSYKITSEINKGTFGAVYRCQHEETGKVFAAKYYSLEWLRSKGATSMVEKEMHAMKLLDHSNTISLEEILFVNHGLVIIMELVEGQNLLENLPKEHGVIESFARQIFTQYLDGLEYLHRHNIVHRDIKLENVMIDHDGNVKIIDYGLAEYVPRKRRTNRGLAVNMECGSLNYLAPEIVISEGRYFHGDLTDIWASGILLYSLVTGHFPFDHDDDEELRAIIHRFGECLDEVLHDGNLSRELEDFLRKIFVMHPKKRLTIAQMREHPWIKGTKLTMPDDDERCSIKKFTSKSENFAVTFHDEKPDRSLSFPKQCPCKKQFANGKLFRGRKIRSVPADYKHGEEDQCDIDSESLSRTTAASGKSRSRNMSKLLGKVFRTSKRMISSVYSRNEGEKSHIEAQSWKPETSR